MNAIQIAHPEIHFIINHTMSSVTAYIAPELIAQLFDKLINNAISFHKPDSPIELNLSQQKQNLIIELKNYGPLIDDNKLSSIFSSLTSYRTQKNTEPHLGIGLYIAYLISDYHQATLTAKNNNQEASVSFLLTLKTKQINSH